MSWSSWCSGPRQLTAAPGQINHGLIDLMTFVHAGVGLVMGLFGLGLVPTLLVAVAWEVAEHLLKNCFPHAFVYPTQDTILNAVGDVIAALLGWTASRSSLFRPARPDQEAPTVAGLRSRPGQMARSSPRTANSSVR